MDFYERTVAVKRLLLTGGLAALLIVPAAYATATTVFNVSASTSRSSVSDWRTNRVGDMTLTLRYSSKGSVVFNAWATDEGVPSMSDFCTATSGAGWITYSCVNAPASGYRAAIWPTKGALTGTLTVVGETD